MKATKVFIINFFISINLFSQGFPDEMQSKVVQYAKDSLIKEFNIGDIYLNESRFCFPMKNKKISDLNYFPFNLYKNEDFQENDSGYFRIHYEYNEDNKTPKFYYWFNIYSIGSFRDTSKVYKFIQHTNFYKSEACSTRYHSYKSIYDTIPIKINYNIKNQSRIEVVAYKLVTLKNKIKLSVELINHGSEDVCILNKPMKELSLQDRNYENLKYDSTYLTPFEIFDNPIIAKSKIKFKRTYHRSDSSLKILLSEPIMYYIKEESSIIYGSTNPIISNPNHLKKIYPLKPIKINLGHIFINEELRFDENVDVNPFIYTDNKSMMYKFHFSNKEIELNYSNNYSTGIHVKNLNSKLESNYTFALDTQIKLYHKALYSDNYPNIPFSLKYAYSNKPRIERKLKTIVKNKNEKIIIVTYKNNSADTVSLGTYYFRDYLLVLNPSQELVKIDTFSMNKKKDLGNYEILYKEIGYYVHSKTLSINGELNALIPVDSIINYTNYPMIVLDTDVCDYGKINKWSDGVRVMKVKNKGNLPLLITNCHGSNIVPTCPREPIYPNKEISISLRYDTGRIGSFHRTMYISSNDPVNPNKIITVRGEVFENNEEENCE